MAHDPNATILAELTIEPSSALPPGPTIELGESIAEGGMGEVLLGRQPRLARTVAVKRPLAGRRGAREALISEALVTGALQHPNIVPIYDLHEDESGPLMVMKRLHGTVWSELLESEEALAPLLEGRSALDFHLDVLLGVCSAVQFAHARGLIHRDIKPDNVMVGAFGEVTLFDWGLAVSTRPEDDGRFPLASDVRRVAGTPAFMAPEMAQGDGAIDARTDVYLLGSALHFLLTRHTRHAGTTLEEVLAAAGRSDPVRWPPGVPPELAAIVDRATAADPETRHPTVEAFRHELLETRRHAASLQLAKVAHRRRGILRRMVELELDGQEQDASTVALLSTEGRFSYRQALERWPDNPGAREGLDDLLRWAARFELHRGNPDPAQALLDELDQPAPELAAKLAEVRARRALQDQAHEELERLQFDRDLSAYAGQRGALGCGMGLMVAALCVAVGALDRTGLWPIGYPEMFAGVGAFAVGIFAVTSVAHRLELNAVGRSQITVMRIITTAVCLHWVGAYAQGLPIPAALAWNALVAGAMLVAAGTILDSAAVIAGLIYLPTWAGILLFPEVAFEIFGIGNVVSYGAFAALTGARVVTR